MIQTLIETYLGILHPGRERKRSPPLTEFFQQYIYIKNKSKQTHSSQHSESTNKLGVHKKYVYAETRKYIFHYKSCKIMHKSCINIIIYSNISNHSIFQSPVVLSMFRDKL